MQLVYPVGYFSGVAMDWPSCPVCGGGGLLPTHWEHVGTRYAAPLCDKCKPEDVKEEQYYKETN